MRLAIGALFISIVSLHVSLNAAPKRSATPSSLRDRIPAAKPKRYASVRDAKDWKNPYLMADEEGFEFLKTGADYKAPMRIVSVSEVIAILEKLPTSNWPYGLIVGVQGQSVCCLYPDGKARSQKNRLDLLKRLREVEVAVSLWPTG